MILYVYGCDTVGSKTIHNTIGTLTIDQLGRSPTPRGQQNIANDRIYILIKQMNIIKPLWLICGVWMIATPYGFAAKTETQK